MSFLQPFLLIALPIASLPIIIHLINQRRYQTTRWGAMMFLLAANKMSRGYARLRQWLILAMRVLAVAALIFVISRPLAGGWLGFTGGGRPELTLILLDRSPSMQQAGAGIVGSKLETGRAQLARTLKTLGSARWVLIESGTNKPRELDSADALLNTTSTEPASVASDIPGMLQAAYDYIKTNKPGRTEVWLCSDIRENDWNPTGGRWKSLQDAFLEFPQGVRFHLLAYPKADPANHAIRVTDVRRVKTADAAEVLVSLTLTREGPADAKETIPVSFEIDGARSQVMVELNGSKAELKDHKLPVEKSRERGWGKVSIPADANIADNDFYFTFDQPLPRLTVVVAEDPQAARPLQLAASISPDPAIKATAEVVGPEQLAGVEWDRVALLLWQAQLPAADAAKVIQGFVDRGGQVIFFPPPSPNSNTFLGVKWGTWVESAAEKPIENWRGDQDILAQTISGAPLPVGALAIRRTCGLTGEFTTLASLRGGAPLLGRVSTNTGGVYFCATTAAPADSAMAQEGVVLYVMVQRCLNAGAASLGLTRQLVAGEAAGETPSTWKRLSDDDGGVLISTDYALHRGAYSAGERILALNRPPAEDSAKVMADATLAGLFKGLDFARVDDQAGNLSALIQEIWRLFLMTMMAAMVVEAALCLPKTAKGRAEGVRA